MADESSGTKIDRDSSAAQQAVHFLKSSLAAVVEQKIAASGQGEGSRLFFPNGIELISLKFKLGAAAEISFVLAGKDAPQEQAVAFDNFGETLDDLRDAPET